MTYKISDLKGNWVAVARCDAGMFQGLSFTLENREAIKEIMFQQIISQGGTPYESGYNVCIKECGQFFRLPVLPAIREGIIEFKSNHYEFSSINFNNGKPSRGDKPKAAQLTDTGFFIKIPNGKISYELKCKL